ncbi:hypothetical protein [Kitasatospora sp. NPDC101183]|uniref:hypothetical protein n=1 Tax=Kitasatospora sp. NPDC101183 TaxID=3364100 RepID=UPI00380C372C
MTVFACARCGAVVTGPLREVALPAHAHQERDGHRYMPVLMEPRTFAVDPEPWGPPWRPWAGLGEAEAAALGVFAPVPYVSLAAPGAVLMAPGDTRGTVLLPEELDGCCAAGGGPNLACAGCGAVVGSQTDDCYAWQTVWLDAPAVRRLASTNAPEEDSWPGPTEPVEPDGWWSDRWRASAGIALAHLLAASEGEPVALPAGLVTEMFGRALARLLPAGPPVRRLALAGPGLDPGAGAGAEILLVPRHPRTGEPWRPPGGAAPVPLDAGVWAHLARPPARSTPRLPPGVERDDPLPLRPMRLFEPQYRLTVDRLARMPAVREPWLRAIHDTLL